MVCYAMAFDDDAMWPMQQSCSKLDKKSFCFGLFYMLSSEHIKVIYRFVARSNFQIV